MCWPDGISFQRASSEALATGGAAAMNAKGAASSAMPTAFDHLCEQADLYLQARTCRHTETEYQQGTQTGMSHDFAHSHSAQRDWCTAEMWPGGGSRAPENSRGTIVQPHRHTRVEAVLGANVSKHLNKHLF